MADTKKIIKTAAGVAAAATAGIAGLTAAGSYYFYKLAIPKNSGMTIKGRETDPETQKKFDARQKRYEDWIAGQTCEDWFVESVDQLKLHATFLPADVPSNMLMIVVHGYRSSGLWDFGEILPAYKAMGFNILMPDDRAHGKSEGDYIGFGWQDHFDVNRWIYYAITKLGEDVQIFLHGVSMGGATVMLCAGDPQPPQVKGIIEDCGYSSLNAEMEYCMKHYYKLPVEPFRSEVEFFAKFKAGYYDFRDCDCLRALEKATVPMLFIHGSADTFVPKDMAIENFSACNSEKKDLVIFEGSEHAESMLDDLAKYTATVKKFVDENKD
ncbi:MAG: alpha/beta hydrolase [Eubacteriales bacterium]|jgi:pimeloyl-ACP methyl ester carboxylesterase